MTPAGWTTQTLADFIELQRGFDLPRRVRREGPYKVLSSGDAHGWHDEGKIAGPGFVIGRATNIGRPTWSDEDFWPLNTTLFAKDFKGNDPKFAYYWFAGHDLSAYNSGSVQPMLNRNYIANLPVEVPPLAEQRGIAATLGALDDKMESNRRSMAKIRSLIRAFFAQTLSSSTVNYVPLGDMTTVIKGRSYKSTELEESSTALVTLKSIDRNGGYKEDGLKSYTGLYKPEQVVSPGEIVVAQTDLTQGAEVVGRGVRVPRSTEYETLVASLDLAIVRPSGDVPMEYLFALLSSESFRQHCRNYVTGTTVLHLAKDAIPTWTAPVVPNAEQARFSETARALLFRMDALSEESIRLAALRKTLLPELISGRLRVQVEGDVS